MSIKAKITTQPTIIVEVGVKGKQGADGVTFYPNVSENGDLSWTNDGGLSNPKTVNVKGDDGYTPVRGTDYWTEGDIAEIKSYVDEYLANNTVQIDDTLTKEGFAADAAAVGDAIGKLPSNEYIVSVFEELKALIKAGNTDGAIAVLDEAILDLAVLG